MSELEDCFETQLKQHGVPAPIREFPFALAVGRKFRFDFAWLAEHIAVEIQGATYQRGAHSTGTGLARDFEKNNLAVQLGWRVFYFDSKMIQDGRAVNFMAELFAEKKENALPELLQTHPTAKLDHACFGTFAQLLKFLRDADTVERVTDGDAEDLVRVAELYLERLKRRKVTITTR